MSRNTRKTSAVARSAVAGLCVLLSVTATLAQQGELPQSGSAPSRARPVSPNATINLVNLLVKQGILTEEQATVLIKQAEDEAYVAREAAKDATAKAQEADKTAAAAAAAVSPPGTKRVTYVPEIVKREMRSQLRQEVLDQAKREKWAAPNTYPDWVSRIRLYGDVRMRYEKQFFPKGNDTSGENLINFNAINTGNGLTIDADNNFIPPARDVDQNRQRFRLRARLGVEADLQEGFVAGLRIATGDSSSPVSTNATLGGGGGNFSKYPLWVDRAWLRYRPNDDLSFSVGRFDNPFFSPTDVMWHNDLGFDGIAAQVKNEISPGFTPFGVAGAFPLYNTLLNYPNTGAGTLVVGSPGANLASEDKYLFGAQGGALLKFNPDVELKFGVAYYYFSNVQGKVSAPCSVPAEACTTDLLRPSFAQYGNTYIPLRDLNPYFLANPNATASQYFGLASPFHVLDLTARLDLAHFRPVHVWVDGTYVNNLAFKRDQLALTAFNNLGASPSPGVPGQYAGGNVGAMGRVTIGHPQFKELWDWSVFASYKYIQSDAVIDAFNDSEFGLGGTNLKGYIVGGALSLGQNVWTTVRWMSANSIAGAPFSVDVFLLDLHGRF